MSSTEEETKEIRAVLIIEIVGKPPEYLTESLENIIKQIGEEKGVTIEKKKINEPLEMKKQKGFYTSYVEVEVLVEEIANLAILMFKYMPSHVEVISPGLVALTNTGWTDILSELTRRLHGYDEVARILQFEKRVLEKKLREVLPKEKDSETKK